MTDRSEPSDRSEQPSKPAAKFCLQDAKAIGSNSCPCRVPCADQDHSPARSDRSEKSDRSEART